MKIHVPNEIAHYKPALQYFMQSMVYKLHSNRHKKFDDGRTPHDLEQQLMGEVHELIAALNSEGQFAIHMECVDVANFAWLMSLSVISTTKEEFDNGRKIDATVKGGASLGHHSNNNRTKS